MRLNLSRVRTESSEGSALPPAGLPEDDTPWQDQDIIAITLDTLHLLSQWLLLAPAACRRAHLSAHANALKCCLVKQRACKALKLNAYPAFRALVLAAALWSPQCGGLLRHGMMHSRQEAFRELGQHLMRALTAPLPEISRLAEQDGVVARTVPMG